MTFKSPPSALIKEPFIFPDPAPFTSSHQARLLALFSTRISHRPLKSLSPAQAANANEKAKRSRIPAVYPNPQTFPR